MHAGHLKQRDDCPRDGATTLAVDDLTGDEAGSCRLVALPGQGFAHSGGENQTQQDGGAADAASHVQFLDATPTLQDCHVQGDNLPL